MPLHEWSQRIDDEALAWFLKHNDDIDARSEVAFRAWLAIDPLHEQAYQRWQRDWESLDTLNKEQLASLGAAHVALLTVPSKSWWLLAKDIWADFLLQPSTRHFALLGAVCMALGVGGLGFYGRYLDQPEFVAHYTTQPGEQKTVALPDQSSLLLDADTRIQVSLYPHQRVFNLEQGQAVLTIHADTERPVLLALAGKQPLTLTQGQVEARQLAPHYYQAQKMTVQDRREQVALAGQQVGAERMVTWADSNQFALWSTGILSFQQASLAQIVAEFNRYQPLTVHFSHDDVAQLTLSGNFAWDQPERFIEQLPQLLPVQVARDATTYIISQ